jgi:hypothetical protein
MTLLSGFDGNLQLLGVSRVAEADIDGSSGVNVRCGTYGFGEIVGAPTCFLT